MRELQKELLEGQEALGAHSFELAQAKAALEGAQHRLADRSRDLATAKEVRGAGTAAGGGWSRMGQGVVTIAGAADQGQKCQVCCAGKGMSH